MDVGTKLVKKDQKPGKMMSTLNKGESAVEGLYKLEPNTEYKVSFTYNPHFNNSQNPTKGIVTRATLLYDSNGVSKFDSGTGSFAIGVDLEKGGVKYSYILNDDGTLTYNATFKTQVVQVRTIMV